MKNFKNLFLLFCVVFCSCKQQSKTNTKQIPSTQTETIVKENDSLFNVVKPLVEEKDLLLSVEVPVEEKDTICGSIKPGAKVDINTIPKEWARVTERDGKKVVLEPCNAGVQKFNFYKNKNEWILSFAWGVDSSDYIINCVYLEGNDLKLSLYSYEGYTTFLTIIDYKKKKEVLKINLDDSYSAEFVNENYSDKYPYFLQPCEECHEPCRLSSYDFYTDVKGTPVDLNSIPKRWLQINNYYEKLFVEKNCKNEILDGFHIEKIDSKWVLKFISEGKVSQEDEILYAILVKDQLQLHLNNETSSNIFAVFYYKPNIESAVLGYSHDAIDYKYVNENGINDYEIQKPKWCD